MTFSPIGFLCAPVPTLPSGVKLHFCRSLSESWCFLHRTFAARDQASTAQWRSQCGWRCTGTSLISISAAAAAEAAAGADAAGASSSSGVTALALPAGQASSPGIVLQSPGANPRPRVATSVAHLMAKTTTCLIGVVGSAGPMPHLALDLGEIDGARAQKSGAPRPLGDPGWR